MTGQEHYEAAERAVERIEPIVNSLTPAEMIAYAQVHATLAMAAADDRIAEDEDRIAGCVPEGTSKFGVVVAGQR